MMFLRTMLPRYHATGGVIPPEATLPLELQDSRACRRAELGSPLSWPRSQVSSDQSTTKQSGVIPLLQPWGSKRAQIPPYDPLMDRVGHQAMRGFESEWSRGGPRPLGRQS